MKRKNSSPGMFTVEMAIIFPVIFFTLIGLMYIGILYYQNIVTQTAAMRAASRTAYSWGALGSEDAWSDDGQLKDFDYTEHDPYSFSSTKREANGLTYFHYLLGQNPDLMESVTDSPTVKRVGFLQPAVTVTAQKHYINPMKGILENIGITVADDYTITATAPVNNSVDFVRTVGFIYDQVELLVN